MTHFSGVLSTVRAAERPSKKASHEHESIHESKVMHSSGERASKLGVGLAKSPALTFTTTALTGVMDLDSQTWLQGYIALDSTSPFLFGVSALLKKTLLESGSAGLHVGGGFGLGRINSGTSQDFAFSIAALGGIHYSLPHASQIKLQVEGGPVFSHRPNSSNFGLGSLSDSLVASILYML